MLPQGNAVEEFRRKIEKALADRQRTPNAQTMQNATKQIDEMMKWAEKELKDPKGISVQLLDKTFVVRDVASPNDGKQCTLFQFLEDGMLLKACFVAGTPLLTAGGAKSIESFVVGDELLSRSEHDACGVVEVKVVEEVFVRHSAIMWVHCGDQKIGTTHEHPFWVVDRGWVAAGLLLVGDRLLGHDNQLVAVTNVVDTGEWATVYNLRVTEHHTDFAITSRQANWLSLQQICTLGFNVLSSEV